MSYNVSNLTLILDLVIDARLNDRRLTKQEFDAVQGFGLQCAHDEDCVLAHGIADMLLNYEKFDKEHTLEFERAYHTLRTIANDKDMDLNR